MIQLASRNQKRNSESLRHGWSPVTVNLSLRKTHAGGAETRCGHRFRNLKVVSKKEKGKEEEERNGKERKGKKRKGKERKGRKGRKRRRKGKERKERKEGKEEGNKDLWMSTKVGRRKRVSDVHRTNIEICKGKHTSREQNVDEKTF